MDELSPMMRQYKELKKEYHDCLLFFRLGDFYEMFFEDAETASKELTLFLTSRDCGNGNRAPMCGVPHHSVDTYINRLIERGYKVAICEQLTDPALSKGLVERGVVRVVTPGTVIEEELLDRDSNNYLFCAACVGTAYGYAFCDVSTGEFSVGEAVDIVALCDVVSRLLPREILLNEAANLRAADIKAALRGAEVLIETHDEWAFDVDYARGILCDHFGVADLGGFGLSSLPLAVRAAGALFDYLRSTQRNALTHINRITVPHMSAYMTLDTQTRRNLELTRSLRDGSTRGTLFSLLNKTCTSMGGRLLKNWITQPLYDKPAIDARLAAVAELKSSLVLSDTLKSCLGGIIDLERLVTRLSYATFDAKNCISLRDSLMRLPALKEAMANVKAPLLAELCGKLDTLTDVCELITSAILQEPAANITEGGIIRDGYNTEVDSLRDAAVNGRQWILDFEEQERKSTGIKGLKVGYNRVFGYYVEVTRSYLSDVPYRYVRKQTLANAERFSTPELKEMEDKLLRSEDLLKKLEFQVFCEVRSSIAAELARIQATAHTVACIDVLRSLAQVASEHHYCRPDITESGGIDIKDGRHPVVEASVLRDFVPNDTALNSKDSLIMILTGPNMAGKSTFMRQVGLLTLMAHMGSFIPAKSAKICLVDRIFTRVGASDDLASGQSTFMVEMTEVSEILNNATSRSLLILDEIGRGTSTFDGLSIAWSVVEYLSKKGGIGAKTMFATHYHELTELEGMLTGVKNYSITVREYGDDIIFLHKIVRGSAGQSFGIEVAKLAGLPQEVIDRSKQILSKLLDSDISKERSRIEIPSAEQMAFPEVISAQDEIMAMLRDTDPNNLTPLQALSVLCELKAKAGR